MASYSKENIFQGLYYDSYHLLLVGDTGVGKTSLLDIACKRPMPLYPVPTTEYVVQKFKLQTLDDRSIDVAVWDTPGIAEIPDSEELLREASAILLVFDLINRHTFEGLGKWMEVIRRSGCPIVKLVGNKHDIVNARAICALDILDFARSHGVDYIEISVAKKINVRYLMYVVVGQLDTMVNGLATVKLPLFVDAYLSKQQSECLLEKKNV